MRKTIYYKVDDYLRDDDFIRYAIDGCSENDQHWTECAENQCQTIRNAFNKALHILQNLDNCTSLSEEEIEVLKSRIFRTLNNRVN